MQNANINIEAITFAPPKFLNTGKNGSYKHFDRPSYDKQKSK